MLSGWKRTRRAKSSTEPPVTSAGTAMGEYVEALEYSQKRPGSWTLPDRKIVRTASSCAGSKDAPPSPSSAKPDVSEQLAQRHTGYARRHGVARAQ